MPIEFQCPKCSRRLRTSDEHAGRQVKCPGCGEALAVPSSSLPTDLELEPASSLQSPRANTMRAGASLGSAPSGTLQPTRIGIGDTLRTTWAIFKQQWKTCVGAALIMFLILGGIQTVLRTMLSGAGRGGDIGSTTAMIGLALSLVSYAVNLWLQCGMVYLMLKVARGEPSASISDLFGGGKWLLNFFVASLIVGIIVTIGFILLIIPGVILALMLWPFQYLIVDRNVEIMESISTAREITKGNKLTVFLMYLLVGIIGLLVVAITLGLGTLVVVPYVALALAVTYLKMTGQPTAADGRS